MVMPNRLGTSFAEVGVFACFIAFNFAGSGDVLSAPKTIAKNPIRGM